MWFKNLQLFQFIEDFDLSAEDLGKQLESYPFQPCRSIDPVSMGWVSPIGEEEGAPLVHAANGFMMLCLKVEEKIIPGSVVRQMVDEKAQEIEDKQGRKVRKKEKETIREDIYHNLLSRAFSKSSLHYAYIDPKGGWLILNAASSSKAEEFTGFLRKTLGSLKIQLPEVQEISILLTDWLKTNQYPAEFAIADSCVIRDTKESGVIRCQKQNLLSDEIQSLLDGGREVVQLALSWSDQVSFVLKEDFSVKSLKFLELVQDQAKDVFTETAQAKFDADFTIMTETLRHLLQGLMKVFGKPSGAKQNEAEAEMA
ncbi:MAG: recombination-associated protein RdgC [Gammaproteobacteria bacterium]|jgi:recombination associated protein RdgC|nr:recombination-associated protein RdgC [Gammaproteobacteria bacterium]